jgi:sortase A
MKVVIPYRSLRRVVQSMQLMLIAAAILGLGYCGFVVLEAWNFQRVEGRRLDLVAAPPAEVLQAVADEGLIGRIEVRRLGLSVVVIEGTTATTLRRAAGHISGTAFPGKAGNVGIAGHRDTFFRPLRNIRQNDIVTLTTTAGEYRYRVVSTKVVSPGDVSVLSPGGGEVLTLVTCYPFYFVGSAPDRFIVRAERVI